MHAEGPPLSLLGPEEPNGGANGRTGAEGVHWNLDDLYPGPDALERDLERTQDQAAGFAERYRGRVGCLDGRELAQAVREYEALQVGLGRAGSYAYLHWCTDTQDSRRGALLQKTREASTQLVRKILFFELEWLQLDEGRAAELLSSRELQPFRHYLEVERLRAPHVLSEPEEKILAEKRVTGRSAWNRLFDQMHGAARYTCGDRKLTREELLSRLYDPDREVRRESALAFSRGLENRVSEMAFISNTMLADKASDDRLRKYPHWLASRNLDNEISDEAVQVLVQAVTG
ncbi:MAG: oligoendopeptidase F, partial [Candidatus Aminicenantes bacterium]|nr:oligoendopeptidase F [Candidatus Aminicenantes bacterium]